MGYEAQTIDQAGTVYIPTQNIPGFEKECVEQFETSGSLSWVHERVRDGALVILGEYGFEVEESPLGGIEVTGFPYSKVGSDWQFIVNAISHAMEEGTEATWEMVGEDSEYWRTTSAAASTPRRRTRADVPGTG